MADFKIKDKVNNANPSGTSAILIDIGSGYQNITIDQLRDLYLAAFDNQLTTIEQDITSLETNKSDTTHTHANATATVAGFMSAAHFTKLENITELFKGYYSSSSGLTTKYPTGQAGWYAYVGTTSKTTWIWDSTLATPAWADTGISSSGDMLASIYDPGSKGVDVYARANHTGTQAIATVDGLQVALDGKEAKFTKNTAFNKNFGVLAGDISEGNHTHADLEKLIHRATTAPTDATKLWIDTSVSPNLLKRYDGASWISIGASSSTITIDTALSTLSANPVENRVVTNAINGKEAAFTKNTAFNKNFGTAAGTVAEGSALALKADKATTLTINGTTYDLSANRSWTVSTQHIFAPVFDIGALKAIDTTDAATWPDKWIIHAETLGLYALDRDSTEAGDDNLVIVPTVGVGRWKKLNVSSGTALSVQDEGTALTAGGTALNFTGAGVTASFDSVNNKYDIAIPGGGSGKIRHDTYNALTLSGTMNWDVNNVAEGKAKIIIPSGTAVTDIAFSLANAADGFTGILAVYNNDTVIHKINLPTAGIYAVTDGETASYTLSAGAISELNFAHDGTKIKVTRGAFVAI